MNAPTPSKAEIADYLEAQADELKRVLSADPEQRKMVADVAERLAHLARQHGLEIVARRFDGLKTPAATGTHGA